MKISDEHRFIRHDYVTLFFMMRLLTVILLLAALFSCRHVRSEPEILVAVRTHDQSRLKELIRIGADLDEKAENGKTALMEAAENGDVSAIKLLLSAGADATLRESTGENALIHAAYEGHAAALELLIGRMHHKDLLTEGLIAATNAGKEETVRLLLKWGAVPEKTNRYGVTAEMIAEQNGQRQLLPILHASQ